MDVDSRMMTIRIIEKIRANKRMAERLGIKEVSHSRRKEDGSSNTIMCGEERK
ncbi:MAG: hypothetical protein VB031_06165 [Eubacteriaceae bacterium]|nr:hypothetical protein [Eubacteriaceae bacterium]